jgi:glycerol-3-phosphate dehydrogenase
MTGSLGPQGRAEALACLSSEDLDLLVVGAGATGSGTALDAAARGLRVGLIDKGDIAGGTSSRSSQLVHGGLRYLQQGDVALVRESLRERELLLTTIAPHLVRPLPFLLPLRHRVWERALMGAGLLAYDVLAGASSLPGHRHVSRRTALAHFPSLRPDALVGGLRYYDAQMDDARLAVAVARTAAAHGAHVAPQVALIASAGTGTDGLQRVVVRDEVTGAEHVVRARCVALCAGVWAPEAAALFTGTTDAVGVVRSKGVHIRLPRTALAGDSALILPTPRSVLFVIPTPTHWLVGTTDTPWPGGPDSVAPDAGDVQYLLDELNPVLAEPISPRQVTYAFAGLRPLVRDQAVGGDTAKVTREHRIARVSPGVLAIVGGKWTTYRLMARDLVDTVLVESGLAARPCPTPHLRLVDAAAAEVRALVAADPDLSRPLVDAPGFRHADVVQACVNEGALRLPDVVDRRLRLGLAVDAVTEPAVRDVASVMGRVLGWTPDATDAAVRDYLSGAGAGLVR